MSTIQTNLVEAWVIALTQHGYHITVQRLAVIELLVEAQRALTAEQLIELALNQEIRLGRATVYRTLELLEMLHLICRVSDGGKHSAIASRLRLPLLSSNAPQTMTIRRPKQRKLCKQINLHVFLLQF